MFVFAFIRNSEKLDKGSMRRENKAYSFKDQLMEIELRQVFLKACIIDD